MEGKEISNRLRYIKINDNQNIKFISNSIKTAKYNMYKMINNKLTHILIRLFNEFNNN
jgi:hypothetical protein